jgi:hypothetical protein
MIVVATSAPIKPTLYSWLIQKYQNTNFSHVLIIKDGIVYEASKASVHTSFFYDWVKSSKLINIYLLDDSKVNLSYVVSKIGTKYGWGQSFRIAIKYIFRFTINVNNKDTRLICSEYVGRALMLDWVTDYTTPKDIDNYLRGLK